MDSTPIQIRQFFEDRGFVVRERNHVGDFPGGGRRFSAHDTDGTMVMNQLTITRPDWTPSPCCWGYLNMKKFRIGNLSPQEIQLINKSQTMRIHYITTERLAQLLDIIYP